MAAKPPQLTIGDDKSASLRVWRRKFNAWCLLQGFRDDTHAQNIAAHYKPDSRNKEIAAFHLALPDNLINLVDTTILPKMSDDERKQPWKYQEKLEQELVGHDNVMPERLSFFHALQLPSETIAEYEQRIRTIASKTRYDQMANPLQELMRDRLATGVHHMDMRQTLLHHYKDDGQTVVTFEEQLAKAKSWEMAYKTNESISQSSKAEEVHYSDNRRRPQFRRRAPFQAQTQSRAPFQPQSRAPFQPQTQSRAPYQPQSCGWCGCPQRHSAKDCPAKAPGSYCTNCYLQESHLANVCRSAKDKHKAEFQNQRSAETKPTPGGAAKYAHAISAEEDDDYHIAHSFNAYTHHDYDAQGYNTTYTISSTEDKDPGDKYFTWLPVVTPMNKTVKVLMQVDSAATCNTLPSDVYDQIAPRHKLLPSRTKILPYGGAPISPIGRYEAACEGSHSYENLSFQVIDSRDIPNKPALLSGKSCALLGLIQFNKNRVFASTTTNIKAPKSAEIVDHAHTLTTNTTLKKPSPGKLTKEDLLTAYPDVFKGQGQVGKPVHFKMNPDVHPTHAGVHRLPVTKMEAVKKKLDEMVTEGKLQKIEEPTDWCSNMTVTEKDLPDGGTKIRICLDPSQTINKAIDIPHYQIPTVAETLPHLAGKKYKTFSIFDALDGFTQVTLDDVSSECTTMHTPWGRYRWLRLPYGVSSGPEEFQLRMHEALENLAETHCIADDIMVVGQGDTREEADKNHDLHVLALMERAQQRNLKLNPRKTQFKLQKITFMGGVISENGYEPDRNKVKPVVDMPAPTDKQGVRRFCGMVNYLNCFCPHLSQVIKPLFELTQEDHDFIWSNTHENAFSKAKHLIATAPCLAFFDPRKPTTLQVDASQGGLGGALLQPNADGKLQPVAFTSCKMRPNEEKWAQIEKECLAIVAACDKWDLWIYGQRITVHSDHLPLQTIFKKPLRSAPRRLQKMMLRLQRYKLDVVYKKGSSLFLADTLSRAPLPTTNVSPQTNFEVFRLDLTPDVTSHTTPGIKPRTFEEVKQATKEDPTMVSLTQTITKGWPDNKANLPPGISPYWAHRDELTVSNGVIFRGLQVLVPPKLYSTMLHRIHIAHMGAASNIRMAKDVLFWPGMRSMIEDTCAACGKCAQYKSQSNTKEPMLSHPIPEYPWQYVSQDLATFNSAHYLVTVDHYSDFIEVDELNDTLASTISKLTEAHITRHGIPEAIITDNGPQFIAHEYEALCRKYGMQHITSSPYWSQGNGKAEASVKILKSFLQKAGHDDLPMALLTYRDTAPQGHELNPAQRSMGRRLRGLLPISKHLLKPSHGTTVDVMDSIMKKRAQAKQQYDKHVGDDSEKLDIGDKVYVKPSPHNRGKPWMYGVVKDSTTPRSYTVQTPRGKVRRNIVQIRSAGAPPHCDMTPIHPTPVYIYPDPVVTPVMPPPQPHAILGTPMRQIIPPVRLDTHRSPASTPRSSDSTPVQTAQKITPPAMLSPQQSTKTDIVTTRSGRVVKPTNKLNL